MKAKAELDEFLKCCGEVLLFPESLRETALQTVKYLRGDSINRGKLRENQLLEKRWYDSLANGGPDYTVYDSDSYLAELWACWRIYSRRYIKDVQRGKMPDGSSLLDDIGPVTVLADLGCGCGDSMLAWKDVYPNAMIVGTNIEKAAQTTIARNRGCKVWELHSIGTVDLVFASEYFEHHEEPLRHLRQVVKILKPRRMLIANAFGTRAVGHFDQYQIDGEKVPAKYVSKIFNNELRTLGYTLTKTKLWNNRPAYWKKNGS